MGKLYLYATYVAGLIGLPIALYNLYYFRGGLNLKFVAFLAVLGLIAFLAHWQKGLSDKKLFATLSVFGAFLVYSAYPDVFVDDTGFVIRYLDQAADGCFYCYNQSEGAVFGISGFLYGLVTLIMALPGWLSPEQIITIVSFVGLVWTLYMVLTIIHLATKNTFLTVSGVGMAILMSKNFLSSAPVGLETAFHMAIVFSAVYYFFKGNDKRFWLFLALSVISKLDAAPMAVVLGGIFLFERREQYLGVAWKQNWKQVILYAGIPMVVFLGLTFWWFGGPMPHSAAAKIDHHPNMSEHWFPFLEKMLDKGERNALLKIGVGLTLLHLGFSLYRREFKLSSFALFGSFLATMFLYYKYNPAERMMWYYALPELLFFTQFVISGAYLTKLVKWQKEARYVVFLGGVGIAAIPLVINEKAWDDEYLLTVEGERLEIGDYLASQMGTSDTLVASHGHFGRHVKGHVIDMSGLNSVLATDLERRTDILLEKYRPERFIHHGEPWHTDLGNAFGYRIERAYFGINKYNAATWILFKRSPSNQHQMERLPASSILRGETFPTGTTYAIKGNNIKLEIPGKSTTRLLIGVEHRALQGEDMAIYLEGSTELLDYELSMYPEMPVSKVQTYEFTFEPVQEGNIIIEMGSEGGLYYDPIVETIKKED